MTVENAPVASSALRWVRSSPRRRRVGQFGREPPVDGVDDGAGLRVEVGEVPEQCGDAAGVEQPRRASAPRRRIDPVPGLRAGDQVERPAARRPTARSCRPRPRCRAPGRRRPSAGRPRRRARPAHGRRAGGPPCRCRSRRRARCAAAPRDEIVDQRRRIARPVAVVVRRDRAEGLGPVALRCGSARRGHGHLVIVPVVLAWSSGHSPIRQSSSGGCGERIGSASVSGLASPGQAGSSPCAGTRARADARCTSATGSGGTRRGQHDVAEPAALAARPGRRSRSVCGSTAAHASPAAAGCSVTGGPSATLASSTPSGRSTRATSAKNSARGQLGRHPAAVEGVEHHDVGARVGQRRRPRCGRRPAGSGSGLPAATAAARGPARSARRRVRARSAASRGG